LLHTYRFENGQLILVEQTPLPTLINNHDYIFAHVGEYTSLGLERETSDKLGEQFEKQVYEALHPHVDEITAGVKPIPDLDIDLMVRCGNQVAFIEVKSGKDTRKGINQLSIASRREYFGIYTEKILISNFDDWEHRGNQKRLAQENKIRVIEITSFSDANPAIGEQDKIQLIKQVCDALGRKF
jgi:Holliday junction resolvase-like predicted endonuclease